ncbi:MAG: bifunctional UDP-N-acetylglucosamine diphosphorylase/glucosamine-1-phosphate N-acetyltransferase GlmU [Anaerolineae bacterium]
MTNSLAVVILAAGQGTRMKSALPKVLHPLNGRPMIRYVLEVATRLEPVETVMVVGHQAGQVREALAGLVVFVEQEPQLGTGHAVQQAHSALAGQAEAVLVLYGDMPLLRAETVSNLFDLYQRTGGPLAMLTVVEDDPRGFGRVVRDGQGRVTTVVEEVDCTPEQLAIKELNVGVYIFQADWLWANLPRVPLSAKGEYYLTDMVGLAVGQDHRVAALTISDNDEAMGINTRVHLAEAEAVLRRRLNRAWMEAGVTMPDPATVYIGPEVEIDPDTVILPNTHLEGQTRVGRECVLGPNSIIRDSKIGDRCRIEASVVESATMEDEANIGPFGHLRKGAHLGRGAHLGNFGEVKNAYLAPGVKMGHFSYVGDARIDENVNIGAGTITCNYAADRKKYRTEIGSETFIGSGSLLVAPLKIGRGAITGAGAVVTKDVADDTVVYGVPARVHPKSQARKSPPEEK